MKVAKKRAITLPENDIGEFRRELYKSAIEKFHSAMQNSHFLEAISICSSLISDRLESRLFHLTGDNEGFKPLGMLISELEARESNPEILELLRTDVEIWKKNRDICLDDIVKCQDHSRVNWDQRQSINQNIALEGFDLFRKLDSKIRGLNHRLYRIK